MVVTYRLSKDARDAGARQALDMQNSLRIAGDMVCAANESAAAAIKSARIAEQSAVRQQRAYVNVFDEAHKPLPRQRPVRRVLPTLKR